ncbi:MAG: MATE family efflux transporter [Eubacteriales bacterium]|nr:MATE family efflux transporter [Eubacteriales bacterium]
MQSQLPSDFSKGKISTNIIRLAIPITLAQLVNILYNIVDRVYIGRFMEHSTTALTGVGICFPIVTIIVSFANLIGTGGGPLFSIERGKKNDEEAEAIMGNSLTLLFGISVFLTIFGLLLRRPLLYALGASDVTFPYANAYITIYLLGTLFVMTSLGMNSFINAQGFGKTAMLTILIGAVLNIALDPVLIFALHLGVRGAAWATVLSQLAAAIWTLRFLTGRKTLLRLRVCNLRCRKTRVRRILSLGLSGFTMGATNSLVQICCNASLGTFGGDLYVGAMTIINSVREILSLPVTGVVNSAQPVIGYNYGAQEHDRVCQAIRFTAILLFCYTLIAWSLVSLFPAFFIHIFNTDLELTSVTIPSMHVYFFGFCFMAFQFSGQTTFLALGKSRFSLFFSLLRKVFIVIPLTLLLPHLGGLGTTGVFLAEPISNVCGGLASFTTMLFVCYFPIRKAAQGKQQHFI